MNKKIKRNIPISILLGVTPITVLFINESNAILGIEKLKFIKSSEYINITDVNLLKGINNALGKGEVTSNVTIEEMESLKTLDLSGKNIKNIEGLEYAINLTDLRMHTNQISDISVLENLTKLTKLYMYNNQISDISILENLTNLTVLDIGSNQISNISALENLTKLTSLNLYGNRISSISEISNLINLNTLHLGGNQISDISQMKKLTKLTELRIEHNQVSDISILENLTNLTKLFIPNNRISEISALENLTKLTTLYINNNQISDISTLENLTNLTVLDLGSNQISDISVLENLTKLAYLSLYGNRISSISEISNLINLNTLHLGGNQISDISDVEKLIKLTDFRIEGNQILDISPLENLTNINILYIQNNQIEDISALEKLTNLIYLSMHTNQILDISPLENLTNLTSLYMYTNQIEDISALENLTNLTTLNIAYNRISDISVLNNLTKLTTLTMNNQKPSIKSTIEVNSNSGISSLKNPIKGINNEFVNITSVSNGGVYKNNNLQWSSLSTGKHNLTASFSKTYRINNQDVIFNGTATIDAIVIDGEPPVVSSDTQLQVSEDGNNIALLSTITATDTMSDAEYLLHKGVRYNLPYTLEYDPFNKENNTVEVFDTTENSTLYTVTPDSFDIKVLTDYIDALNSKPNKTIEDVSKIRAISNDMSESSNKDLIVDKINELNIIEPLERLNTTSNIDVYIKSENLLSMSLNTNMITFDDFSGVEDLEKVNAVNITINSSLPYQLNAYLPKGIENADKSNAMDLSILNIKENSESTYQTFANTTDKIILKDNNQAGNNLIHNIDIKLKGGIAHQKDVYKTTIKFEVQQK